ncbi:MAG: adenylate/guanylate cyclase domain-containing protein [Verrucomicrobiota bacterium]
MSHSPSRQERGEQWIERLDKPMLGLAAASVLLYLLDLLGWFDGPGAHDVFRTIVLLIDLAFVADLTLKTLCLGPAYLRTPWFLIDALTCLPVLAWFGSGLPLLEGVQFARGLRIFRVLRGFRMLRFLKAFPPFRHLQTASPQCEPTRNFVRALYVGVLLATAVFLGAMAAIERSVESDFKKQTEQRLRRPLSLAELRNLGATLSPPAGHDFLSFSARVNHEIRTVYFDRHPLERTANRIEFYLVLGALAGMLLILYVLFYQMQDVSFGQLRAFLLIVLPRQVAEYFILKPGAYAEKHRMPGSILFMDIYGFTKTCEKLGQDLETLSSHLEKVMDTVVNELSKHDLIIDKFIGDAVMSFRGGPLTKGDAAENAYRMVQAGLDASKALKKLNDPYFNRMKIGGTSAPDCLIGAFGTSTRISYTILGDGVNLAARLEQACGQCDTDNLFCEMTRRLCAERKDILWRCWGQIRVPGKAERLNVYEAFRAADLPDPAACLETFHAGLTAYQGRDFARAKELFALANQQWPGGDKPSRNYLRWCDELLSQGIPEDWEPSLRTQKHLY